MTVESRMQALLDSSPKFAKISSEDVRYAIASLVEHIEATYGAVVEPTSYHQASGMHLALGPASPSNFAVIEILTGEPVIKLSLKGTPENYDRLVGAIQMEPMSAGWSRFKFQGICALDSARRAIDIAAVKGGIV